MPINEFIAAALQAEEPEALFTLFQATVGKLGFDRVMYSSLVPAPGQSDVGPAIARNYPDDWIAHYVAMGYDRTDPVRRHGLSTFTPFTWATMERTAELSAADRRMLRQAEDAGLRDGVGIPFHMPHGAVMGVGLASSSGHADAERQLSTLWHLSMQFHASFLTLRPRPVQTVRLTPREREVLQWAAVGKSNTVIADILNLSEHGVDYHLRNILRKLDADTRVTACVKGLKMGLVALA